MYLAMQKQDKEMTWQRQNTLMLSTKDSFSEVTSDKVPPMQKTNQSVPITGKQASKQTNTSTLGLSLGQILNLHIQL